VVVSSLPPAEQQKVEIVRALARQAQVIIFDEPTAPLTLNESEALYAVLRKLRAQGTTIVFISHFLEEVLGLADTVTVLKDGRHVQTGPAADATVDSLILAMLGRSLDATFPPKQRCAPSAPVMLEVRDLRREGVIEPSSITVRAGEIVGLAGLVGSGRTELARLIFGADPSDGGTVHVDGHPLRARSPRDAIKRGIAYVPESRKDQGMILTRSVRENITLPSLGDLSGGGFVRRRAERVMTEKVIGTIDLRPPEPERSIATLSGGNQQKIVFGRWLMREPRVLIADEPTRGVDVGAKHALYELLLGLAERGTAVLFISSELEEITGLAHRIYVMRQGTVVAELDGDADDDRILAAAFGGNEGVHTQ
jgi:ABC-type sugar transport system ATPase subunit